jgi:hypothetical protein
MDRKKHTVYTKEKRNGGFVFCLAEGFKEDTGNIF